MGKLEKNLFPKSFVKGEGGRRGRKVNEENLFVDFIYRRVKILRKEEEVVRKRCIYFC